MAMVSTVAIDPRVLAAATIVAGVDECGSEHISGFGLHRACTQLRLHTGPRDTPVSILRRFLESMNASKETKGP